MLFMYLNVKRDVYEVQRENQVLHKKVMESVSDTKTSLYKKNLVESDLKGLKEENKECQDRKTELSQQLKELELQLVRC